MLKHITIGYKMLKSFIASVVKKTVVESKLVGHAANPWWSSPATYYNHNSKSFKRNKRKGL